MDRCVLGFSIPENRAVCHNPYMTAAELPTERDRNQRNLDLLRQHLGAGAGAALAQRLPTELRRLPDPDRALNNLERLAQQSVHQPTLAALATSADEQLHHLLTLLATSQFFADTLMTDPGAILVALAPPGRNPSTAELVSQLRAEMEPQDDARQLRALRLFRQRQMLRIGVNDLIRERPLEEVTRELARLADACIDVALGIALKNATKKFGTPNTQRGKTARITALAFGKLGGDELNYSSDIDLMFLYDDEGETTGKRAGIIPNSEFFARVVTDTIRLLSAVTDRGFAYRTDLRLRPEGARGPLTRSLASTISYYDVMGRTWERQALIKLRHCGGDPDLGREFMNAIEPFIYRKYFSFSEINEVKALKRRMEQQATRSGSDERDVKTGRGGIRDIEYTVQFLQLLNGGDLPAVRQRNTLLALEALEIAGCLTAQETYCLADSYRFLRKTEHRLQLLFDLQTHRLPADVGEIRKLALRLGYEERRPTEPDQPANAETAPNLSAQRRSPLDEAVPDHRLNPRDLLIDPLDLFLQDLHDTTRLNRVILNHLLHQTFGNADHPAESDPVADLILDPDPEDVAVEQVLSRYGFRELPKAYNNLLLLAKESVPFLSHRRCRHFFASIAPQLLHVVSETPDPDESLNNLEKVTASLGAKAVLYELLSANQPSLKLYVELCSGSPFLSGILINNPGMIDELLDSLVLDQPRDLAEFQNELTELTRGANDLEPIYKSFQDKELLRIGVRDILKKGTIQSTTTELSALAEAILQSVVNIQEQDLCQRHAVATLGEY
ncbi:MAG: bifunctional [glutamate--ammonia ligase]-adenylyl-L-tyrosine phosphorylase/[glutamate--ammonia-ligase] adenylyltransferase, partial [Gemmataceae bacterium]